MKILERLPMLSQRQEVRFGRHNERSTPFYRDALLVWLSIGLRGELDSQRISPPFPAMLDSGNTSEAYLHEHHLVHWAGMRPALLAILHTKKIHEVATPFREADIWIHPNIPGTHERDPAKKPYRLETKHGIAIRPAQQDQSIHPRVPLLGFSALRANDLDFYFDSKTGHCYLRTADWRSRIMRLLGKLP